MCTNSCKYGQVREAKVPGGSVGWSETVRLIPHLLLPLLCSDARLYCPLFLIFFFECFSPSRSVSWTSPLGFPVMQPYKHYHKCKVQTSLQNVSIYKDDDELSDPSRPDGVDMKGKDRDKVKIDKRAQTTAFPPNFIHSLDSTHMMLTAIECSRRGVAFAGI